MACDLLHDRHGALADERDRHRMGAHALARDATGGVGGISPTRRAGPVKSLIIRPGVANKALWNPTRTPRWQWEKVRKAVLERDDFTCGGCGHRAIKGMNIHHVDPGSDDSMTNLVPLCTACHAVMHVGMSLQYGSVEIWESAIDQVAIIRATRDGVRLGKSLAAVKATFRLRRGDLAPDSVEYANRMLRGMGEAPWAALPQPLCAVFVKFKTWQLAD